MWNFPSDPLTGTGGASTDATTGVNTFSVSDFIFPILLPLLSLQPPYVKKTADIRTKGKNNFDVFLINSKTLLNDALLNSDTSDI